MKNLWTCRRTFLATLTISGLLFIMYSRDKDYAFEAAALAGGVAFTNAWQARGQKNDPKP